MKNINYRKIWEDYNQACLLPGVDIHHKDGNRNNNSIENLLALTLQEHYDIHYAQGDYSACDKIAFRMKTPLSKEFLSEISKLSNTQRLKEGKHNFSKQNRKSRMGNEFTSETAKETALKRVKEGRHNFVNTDNKNQKEIAYKRIINNEIFEYLVGKSKMSVGIQFGRAKKYAEEKGLFWDTKWDDLKQTLQQKAKKSR